MKHSTRNLAFSLLVISSWGCTTTPDPDAKSAYLERFPQSTSDESSSTKASEDTKPASNPPAPPKPCRFSTKEESRVKQALQLHHLEQNLTPAQQTSYYQQKPQLTLISQRLHLLQAMQPPQTPAEPASPSPHTEEDTEIELESAEEEGTAEIELAEAKQESTEEDEVANTEQEGTENTEPASVQTKEPLRDSDSQYYSWTEDQHKSLCNLSAEEKAQITQIFQLHYLEEYLDPKYHSLYYDQKQNMETDAERISFLQQAHAGKISLSVQNAQLGNYSYPPPLPPSLGGGEPLNGTAFQRGKGQKGRVGTQIEDSGSPSLTRQIASAPKVEGSPSPQDKEPLALDMTMPQVRKLLGAPKQVFHAGAKSVGNALWEYERTAQTSSGFRPQFQLVYFQNHRVVGWRTQDLPTTQKDPQTAQ